MLIISRKNSGTERLTFQFGQKFNLWNFLNNQLNYKFHIFNRRQNYFHITFVTIATAIMKNSRRYTSRERNDADLKYRIPSVR